MTGQIQLQVIHVAGSRMIAQGTDGLSWGDYACGVMRGLPLLLYVPLHLDAFTRSPLLLSWVQSWAPLPDLQPLSPEGWFWEGHGRISPMPAPHVTQEPSSGLPLVYLWSPPPAAASVAVDELALSRLKRTHLLHIFICPRLCTHSRRKKLFKIVDLVLELPPGTQAVWSIDMHEPLILAFVFPLLPIYPWHLRHFPRVPWVGPCVVCGIVQDQMLGIFCANFATCRAPWPACHQLWCGPCYTPHPLDKFYQHRPWDEAGFEWGPKEDASSLQSTRPGDHLLVPFQCDLCSFRNLTRRNPSPSSPQDTFLLCCIRRANLDSVWGRESNTMSATLRGTKQLIALWRVAHIPVELPVRGPFPVGDSFGLRVAIGMLTKSLEPGHYSQFYQQFETIRKLRAAFSNLYMSSVEGVTSLRTMGGETAKMTLTLPPTNSLWFERFVEVCLKRMGQDIRQDWAIPLPVIHILLEMLDNEWHHSVAWVDQHRVTRAGSFAAVAFCGSFRGHEVFRTDLFGLGKYLAEISEKPFVIIPLLGKYKGEAHQRYHLTPMAAITGSGIQVRTWIKRLVQVQHEVGRSHGPAFGDKH